MIYAHKGLALISQRKGKGKGKAELSCGSKVNYVDHKWKATEAFKVKNVS